MNSQLKFLVQHKSMFIVFYFLIIYQPLTYAQELKLDELYSLECITSKPRSLEFSPNGNYFVMAVYHYIQLYDKNFNLLTYFSTDDEYAIEQSVAFSQDDKYCALSFYKRTGTSADPNDQSFYIAIIDLAQLKIIDTIPSHNDYHTKIMFSPDGNYLVSTSDDRIIKIWRIINNNFIKIQDIQIKQRINDFTFHPTKNFIIFSTSNSIHFYNEKNGKFNFLEKIPTTGSSKALSLNSDGTYLSFSMIPKQIMIYRWSGNNYVLFQTLKSTKSGISSVMFHPFLNIFVSSYFDGSIIFWKLKDDKFVSCQKFAETSSMAISPIFSYDGKFFAAIFAGQLSSHVKVWKLKR